MKSVKASHHERRKHQRAQARLPVNISSQEGVTLDVSPGGFCLQLDSELEEDSKYYFEMRLATEQPVYLTGLARVTRREIREKLLCYGMQILFSKVELI